MACQFLAVVTAINPAVTTDSAYISSENQKLFISAGVVSGENFRSTQFISLDLSVPWNSDAPAWKSLAPHPDEPNPYMALNKDNTKIFSVGGSVHQYDIQTDTWKLDGPKDRFLGSGLFSRGAVTDTDTGLIYGVGNSLNLNRTKQMIEFNPIDSTYNKINTTGSRPKLEDLVSLVYSSPAKKIYMYEWLGDGNQTALLTFGVGSQSWAEVNTTGDVPPHRYFPCFTSAYDGKKLILAGGIIQTPTSYKSMDDIYMFDVTTATWTKLANLPKAYSGASCAASGDSFIIWGGRVILGVLEDQMKFIEGGPSVLDMQKNQWGTSYTPSSPTDSPNSSGTGASVVAAILAIVTVVSSVMVL
ncbi:Leucine-zipper-like transcriptional regulator 1 [Mortierella sp. AM989]|nr:Leucine-zipper-like transcriptional regulator 1 [Mortierella sp. AM989]